MVKWRRNDVDTLKIIGVLMHSRIADGPTVHRPLTAVSLAIALQVLDAEFFLLVNLFNSSKPFKL